MTQLVVIACLAFDHRAPADDVQRFKACLLQCPQVERAMEVCGTFDLIIEGRCSDIANYTRGMERLRKPLSQLVSRIETSFVSRTMDRPSSVEEDGGAIWLPCHDGRRRVEHRQIDKIVAEGDYMRVHVGNWSCLVHDTMSHLAKALAGAGFVQLHRSWLVRISFIERLVHDQRRWTARLMDGTTVSVAKSHTQDVLAIISGESSKPGGHSAIRSEVGERSDEVNENLLKLTS
ncbi:LytTR family transcriptional regulator DNA-binding domain-containing protein [Sphingomonas glaciei]|uniref:LytTR family transcriptional regulator DNA-binding domain-containing protein n=1 Tax=Sphingomonas glaciei TaxID=2938948 RepID=A0ABY5MVB1_9SPHN|nr:LytTR family transcriptional regulator DNA-binding domain-containing protein [Sphingomonas glaciei]UUR07369.1 LytTR family transcriptional regulator DNA-binding domain-containing protein [Sphingomonas glaciei]